MAEGLLKREPIPEFGEFRAYLRPERDEMVFEAFREGDGRAWLLRVPLPARSAMVGLLRDVGPMLTREPVTDGEPEILRQVALGPADQLVAILLADGEERAFALWRQERLRTGWSWTVDVLVVPLALARRLCGLLQQALDQGAGLRPA